MKLCLFLILIPMFALAAPQCERPISRENFEGIMLETRDHFFPELRSIKLTVTTFKSDSSFLQARPVIKSLFRGDSKRRYTVMLNEKLLKCPPSLLALEAILVHEIEHIRDYTQWNSAHIAWHGARYGLSFGFKASYERATDRKVLDKGLVEGLAQYREWVYQWLTPKQLSKKRKMYLTPEEIRAMVL